MQTYTGKVVTRNEGQLALRCLVWCLACQLQLWFLSQAHLLRQRVLLKVGTRHLYSLHSVFHQSKIENDFSEIHQVDYNFISISCSSSDVHRWRIKHQRKGGFYAETFCFFISLAASLSADCQIDFSPVKARPCSPTLFIYLVKLQSCGGSPREVGWLGRFSLMRRMYGLKLNV